MMIFNLFAPKIDYENFSDSCKRRIGKPKHTIYSKHELKAIKKRRFKNKNAKKARKISRK